MIDGEAQRRVRGAEKGAYRRLSDDRDKLRLLTATLLEREELDRDDLEKLLGPRSTEEMAKS